LAGNLANTVATDAAACASKSFSACALTLVSGVGVNTQIDLDNTADPLHLPLTSGWHSVFTAAIPGATTAQAAGVVAATLTYLVEAAVTEGRTSFSALNDVWTGVIAANGFVSFVAGVVFSGDYPTYQAAFGVVTDTTTYVAVHNQFGSEVVPATYEESTATCELYVALGQIVPPPVGGECTFLHLLTNGLPLLTADADEGLAGLIEDLVSLYTQCVETVDGSIVIPTQSIEGTTPDQCPQYWPSLFLHFTYLNGLEPGKYFEDNNAVYEQGKAACKDDDEDLAAIGTAQIMVPIGVALAALGVVVGVAGAVTEKKPVNLAAGAVALIGGLMVLGGLLIVRGAPIYSSVGGDVEPGSAYYKAGTAQLMGLVSIGASSIGGIVLLVSAFVNPCQSETTTDIEQKTTSI